MPKGDAGKTMHASYPLTDSECNTKKGRRKGSGPCITHEVQVSEIPIEAPKMISVRLDGHAQTRLATESKSQMDLAHYVRDSHNIRYTLFLHKSTSYMKDRPLKFPGPIHKGMNSKSFLSKIIAR